MGLKEGQIKCINTLDAPLVVAAGAGSGKTFTLTKRIVHALEIGAVEDIGEVCAITFTKNAAAELKSRIKSELRARGMTQQALKVDDAWISTIHGMCARILRSNAIELGIDPAFQVAENELVEDYLSLAIDEVLKSASAEKSEKLDALFEAYRPRSFDAYDKNSVESMLKILVEKAVSHPNGTASFVLPEVSQCPQLIVEQVLTAVEELLSLAQEAKARKEAAKKGVKTLDGWISDTEVQVGAVRAALKCSVESYEEAIGHLAAFKFRKDLAGKEGAKGFSEDDAYFKEQILHTQGMRDALLMEARLGAASVHLETLVELTEQAYELFVQMKRKNGLLDNNDLLVMAAQAFEEYPSIAQRYTNKFKLVMVDEFQDTDQMQVDMIKRVSGPDAQRLCVVGDAQQSIYRFRGADVSVYRRHLASVQEQYPNSIIKLADNFRSHPDVLAFVDRVFGRPNMFGDDFMSLTAGRNEAEIEPAFNAAHPRITVQHTAYPYRGVSVDQATEVVAQRIAHEFAQLRDAGHAPGEMVVLLGGMNRSEIYARALREQGLPCVITGGSVFAQSQEVALVTALVRAIASPRETQALFTVLTGPIFGLTAGDLLEVGGLAGFWRAATQTDETDPELTLEALSPCLQCALRVMGSVREAAGKHSVSRIIERVALESGWLSRLEQQGAEGLASAGNIYKAIRMITSIEQAGATGPVSVMQRFEQKLASAKEAPGALSVSGGNSVRIMTIHASKGLEFPIVAVAEIKDNKESTALLRASSVEGKVYLSLDLGDSDGANGKADAALVRKYLFGDQTFQDESEFAAAIQANPDVLHRWILLKDFEARGDAEEAQRLLYVAITRAKEAVLVASMGKRTKDNAKGLPKNVLADVIEALEQLSDSDALNADDTYSRSEIEFGGSAKAVLECKVLTAEAQDVEPGAELEDDESCSDEADEPQKYMVPAPERCAPESRTPPTREAFQNFREGVFSYSSISDATQKDSLLSRLAETFAIASDQAALEEDEDVSFDGATDLGTAFHRLAQYAALARQAGELLAVPPSERVEIMARQCELDVKQCERLTNALDRWFDCELAHEMSGLCELSAEVPFFISLGEFYLEGEIDLLGFDERHEHARVVDYKTGGSVDESADDLRCKHVLQAACYAYAILLQGVKSVDIAFVRVERGRADDASQPQCVYYHFEAADLSKLESSISEAIALAHH